MGIWAWLFGLRAQPGKPGRNPCRRCGACCEVYGHSLRAEAEDLARWRREGRLDLAVQVGPGGELWVDRASGQRLGDCPFLVRVPARGSRCRIEHTKPLICRRYPTRAHGFRCVRGVRYSAS